MSCVFNPLQLYALLKKQESPVLFRTGDSGARGGSRTHPKVKKAVVLQWFPRKKARMCDISRDILHIRSPCLHLA